MRLVYNKLSKEVVTLIEDDNSITSFPPDYGVIQGDIEMLSEIAAIQGIDVSQFEELNMTNERKKVLLRLHRCKMVKLRFLEENASITIENSASLLQAFMNVSMLLDLGDAKTALTILQGMDEATFPVTPAYADNAERKGSYVSELQEIVDTLFETTI